MTAPAPVAPLAAPAAPPTGRPTNGLAIATLVLGLCGFALLPVILGHVALGQIRRTGAGGSALAIVGLVLGYLACAAYLIAGIVVAASILWAVSA